MTRQNGTCRNLNINLNLKIFFVDDITLREFYLLYTRTAILRAELSKALEIVDSAMRLPSVCKDLFYRSECSFFKGNVPDVSGQTATGGNVCTVCPGGSTKKWE